MIDLNNLEEIKKLDPKNVLGSTGMLAGQCKQIWSAAKTIDCPVAYKEVENIVICGMGGSAYGGHVVKLLFKNELRVPLLTNSDYHLPGFVDASTLVILNSYSGSTEEILSCADEAFSKNAKIVGLSSGGKLGDLLKSENLPVLIFESKFNPSAQPRLGTGYIIFGTMGILNKIGVLNIDDKIIEKAISELEVNQENIRSNSIEIAKKIVGKITLVLASEFLAGNAHIIRNQFNETAKSFASYSELPELNHHLMEGLKNPEDNKLIVLFINSSLYSPIIKKRGELTKDVIQKNNIGLTEYEAKGSEKISQMLNVLSFGGYVSLYLALLYGQDPSLIPWVDYFKEQLKKTP